MFYFNSVQKVIETVGKLRPGALAFLAPGLEVTYGQLLIDLDKASRFLLSQGLHAGDGVLILMPASYLHVLLMLASDRLGIASLSNQFVKADVLGEEWASKLGIKCVFATVPAPLHRDINWIEFAPRATANALKVPDDFARVDIYDDVEPERVTRWIRSSGTTRTSKVVALTRELVMKRILINHLLIEGGGNNRHLITMPPGTSGGYVFWLSALCRGATLIPWLGDTAFPRLIDTFSVSHLILTPLALRNVVLNGVRQGRSHDSVKMTATSGAVFDVALANQARAVLGPDIWNSYASTESGLIARGHINQMRQDPRLVGAVLPFIDLEIVDENDNILPAGEQGLVRVASELNVSGYVNVADETSFRNGYAYPGDMGSLDERGYLKIFGRADNVINYRGMKFLPEALERQVSALPEVKGVCVVQVEVKGQPSLCAAVELIEGAVAAEVSNKIRTALGQRAPQFIQVVRQLPRNDMGKIVRPELQKQLAEHLNPDKKGDGGN